MENRAESQPAFGPYRIVSRLGSGGACTTYSATHRTDGVPVAVKVPHSRCLDDPTYRDRFARAAEAARELGHEHIASVLDHGQSRGRPYLVVDLVVGRTLRSHLADVGVLPCPRALELSIQIAAALDHAHGRGVVHGNLTPDNVMILYDVGRAVLTDFGVARFEDAPSLAKLFMFLTTPTYLAPEVMRGDTADHRRDVYALRLDALRDARRPSALCRVPATRAARDQGRELAARRDLGGRHTSAGAVVPGARPGGSPARGPSGERVPASVPPSRPRRLQRIGISVCETSGWSHIPALGCAQRVLLGACAVLAPRTPSHNETAQWGQCGTRSQPHSMVDCRP